MLRRGAPLGNHSSKALRKFLPHGGVQEFFERTARHFPVCDRERSRDVYLMCRLIFFVTRFFVL